MDMAIGANTFPSGDCGAHIMLRTGVGPLASVARMRRGVVIFDGLGGSSGGVSERCPAADGSLTRATGTLLGEATVEVPVREAKGLTSKLLGKLGAGAVITESSKDGERIQYSKVSGSGPASGWVSANFSVCGINCKHS